MKGKYAPLVAAVIAVGIGGSLSPSWAQLPPTNMGKWVHQPGDNQYSLNEQVKRHGDSGYIDTAGGGSVIIKHTGGGAAGGAAAASGGGSHGGGSIMGGSVGRKSDISIEPISADEPIPPGGFPPLPERLDLPVAPSAGWGKELASPRRSGGGGSGGGGGGGPSGPSGYHQHYAHYEPGAFLRKGEGGDGDGGGGGGGGAPMGAVPGVSEDGSSSVGGHSPNANPAQNGGGSVGYYKCRSAPAPSVNHGSSVGDSFNSNSASGAASPPPRYGGASSRDIKKLGQEPKLDDRQDAAGAPEAPQAAIINQSTTQDLSLPDDEFVSRYGLQDTKGKRFAKRMGMRGKAIGKSMIRRVTGPIGF